MFSAPHFKCLKTQTRDELRMHYFSSAKHFSSCTVALSYSLHVNMGKSDFLNQSLVDHTARADTMMWLVRGESEAARCANYGWGKWSFLGQTKQWHFTKSSYDQTIPEIQQQDREGIQRQDLSATTGQIVTELKRCCPRRWRMVQMLLTPALVQIAPFTLLEVLTKTIYPRSAGQGLLGKPSCPDFPGSSGVKLLELIAWSCSLDPGSPPTCDTAVQLHRNRKVCPWGKRQRWAVLGTTAKILSEFVQLSSKPQMQKAGSLWRKVRTEQSEIKQLFCRSDAIWRVVFFCSLQGVITSLSLCS